MCLSEGFSETVKNATIENFEVIKRKIKVLDSLKCFEVNLKDSKQKNKKEKQNKRSMY